LPYGYHSRPGIGYSLGQITGALFTIQKSMPDRKKFLLSPSGKSPLLVSAISRPKRGAYRDRHGRWARDAMDAAAHETNARAADGEVVEF
jgi:hypothetical protein